MRVVFDVSVLVRFTMGSALVAKLLRHVAESGHAVLSCEMLVEELTATAVKPRLAAYVDRSVCEDLVSFLRSAGDQVSVVQPFPPCRDKDDGYLLAMARDGAANFLVTNDQDLLTLAKIGQCEIVTPEEFSRRLGEKGDEL